MFLAHAQTPLNREQHKKVVRIIHNLLNMNESISFRKPVCYRALGLDDYKDIVKKPIDLNMIRRLNNDWKYKLLEEVLDDIQLCWNNCRAYNKPGSDIYECAVLMEQNFVQQLLQQYPGYKIPEGVIRGREPITSMNLVGSTVVEKEPPKTSPPERAQKLEKSQTTQSNIYERHYDRPMNSRARQRSDRPSRTSGSRVENSRLDSPEERADSARPYLEDSNLEIEPQSKDVDGDLPPLSELAIGERKSPSSTPKNKASPPNQPEEMEDEQQLNQQPLAAPEEALEEQQPAMVVEQQSMEGQRQPEQAHQPIIIKLPEVPSLQALVHLSERIKQVVDKSVLQNIVKIMQDKEKISGKTGEHTYRFNATNMKWDTFLLIEDYLDKNRRNQN